MPHRYNGSRSSSIWISEELLEKAAMVAEELGYDSFSAFVRDLLEEAVAAYETARLIGEPPRAAKRRVRDSIFSRILRLARRYPLYQSLLLI